jgi:AcrR family transcriptional regulator
MSHAEPILRAPTSKGADRAAAILAAAKNIIVAEGFSGLSYRNIAKATGIAVGNVNYYYPSKDDLMVDLANFIFDRWDERFQKRVPSALTDDRAIFLFSVRFMIEENKRDRTISLLMEMWAFSNHSPSVAKMLDAFYGKMRAWIGGMIGRVKPGLDPQRLALRAALVTAQIEGLMILIGPKRFAHPELKGLEDAAVAQIEALAFAD